MVYENQIFTCYRFHSKIKGLSHINPDGSDRQSLVKRCKKGEFLNLVKEPDNPVDPDAIAIYHPSGVQLGYLSADLANQYVTYVDGDDGWIFVVVNELTGGTDDKKSIGCNILLYIFEGDCPREVVAKYVSSKYGTHFESIHTSKPNILPIPSQPTPSYSKPEKKSNSNGCLGPLTGCFMLGISVPIILFLIIFVASVGKSCNDPYRSSYRGSYVSPPNQNLYSSESTLEIEPDSIENSTIIHTVHPGESVGKIAMQYTGITPEDIITANDLTAPYTLKIGQSLVIPSKKQSDRGDGP